MTNQVSQEVARGEVVMIQDNCLATLFLAITDVHNYGSMHSYKSEPFPDYPSHTLALFMPISTFSTTSPASLIH